MTQTLIASEKKQFLIGFDRPFCVIGERINPTGRKKLAAEMQAGNFETVIKDALAQTGPAQTSLTSMPASPPSIPTRPNRRSSSGRSRSCSR